MLNLLDRDAGPLVEWDTIGQPRFDRLIEALIPYQHPGESRVEIINGLGGDGGRDAIVIEPDGRKIIYQLKYFPEGFDGKERSRRRQISNPSPDRRNWGSLEHALEHDPDEWILVAPCNPQVSGWSWIRDLQNKYGDRTKITFVGRTQLDGSRWCAGHQDIVRALHSRDEMLVKAEIYRQEPAVLTKSSDLNDRIRALANVVDDVDPAWTLDFARIGSQTVQTLRAKHPSSPQTNPITANFTINGPADDPQVSAFTTAVDYGGFTPVRIPGELVADFRVTGSTLVEHDELEHVLESIELHPGVHAPEEKQASILLRDVDDRVIATHSGIVPRVSPGTRGFTLEHVLYGMLTMTWRIPEDQSAEGSVAITFDSTPAADAASLLRAMKLTRDLASAATVELRVRGTSIMRAGFTNPSRAAMDAEAGASRALMETVDDLAYVQQETNTFFPVPETITTLNRIWLRVLRRALEGRMCFGPETRTAFNVTITPGILEVEDKVPLLAGEPGMMLVQPESSSFELGDHEILLPGPLAFVMRSVTLQDASAVLSRLKRSENVPAVIKSNNDRHVVVYMPARIAPDTLVVPEPWGLTDVEELPEIS